MNKSKELPNATLKDNSQTPIPTDFVDKYLKDFDEIYNDGDVIESDDCISDNDGFDMDDLDIDYNVNIESNYSHSYNSIRHSRDLENDFQMSLMTSRDTKTSKSEKINGLKWELNGKLQAPLGLGYRGKTRIKNNSSSFETEVESLLAFLPLKFWVYHLNECNRYVDEFLSTREPSTKKFVGMNWKPIKIDELMTFYAIIIQMACRPSPGKRYDECWNYTNDWYTNCKHMKITRYKQIRSSLHWCDNPHSTVKVDTLYKVRPMINILERTIGMYLEVGEDLALDETTIGLYHTYAKALTFFNPKKPRGKHHCKIFVLCENDNWAAINFKFCHKSQESFKEKERRKNKARGIETIVENDNNDPDDGDAALQNTFFKSVVSNNKRLMIDLDSDSDSANNEIIDDENNYDDDYGKLVELVTSMCKCVKGTGVVVNMDNYFSSPESFIRLKEMGIMLVERLERPRNTYHSL